MLDKLWLATALYAYPSLNFYINLYQKRLKSFSDMSINALASYEADNFAEKIAGLRDKADNLAVLKNTVETALSLISREKREVIELFYFKKLTGVQIINKLGIPYNTYRYRKRVGIAGLSLYMFMLGITNERFVEFFDEEPLMVMICECIMDKNLVHGCDKALEQAVSE